MIGTIATITIIDFFFTLEIFDLYTFGLDFILVYSNLFRIKDFVVVVALAATQHIYL
jgi:hypothetical protein